MASLYFHTAAGQVTCVVCTRRVQRVYPGRSFRGDDGGTYVVNRMMPCGCTTIHDVPVTWDTRSAS